MEAMMTPRDLLAGVRLSAMGSPEMDPLADKDALVSAPLVEAVYDAVNMRVGLLFDLRVAVQLRMVNTGLIVLGSVEAFQWRAERRRSARTSWNVDVSVPSKKDGLVRLRLVFFPFAELTVVARNAAFFGGDVPGLPDVPPDFGGSDAVVAAGMTSMESPFELVQATFIEAFT
jgi:hypothetical protein